MSQSLQGHTGVIYRLAWSPDGRLIASPSQDNTVRIWDVASGQETLLFTGHNHEVNAAAWSPTGELIASCSDDNDVLIWDAASGKVLHRFTDHTDEVNDVHWSPDGAAIASVSDDKRLVIRSLATSQVERMQSHTKAIWTVRWSPDGQWIATGSDDETILIWSAATNRVWRVLEGHDATIRSVRWFNDSLRVVSADRAGTVRFWNIRKDSLAGPQMIANAHEKMITSIDVSHGDDMIATKGNDDFVRVWRVADGELLDQKHEVGDKRWWSVSLAFHPSEPKLASLEHHNKIINVWELPDDIVSREIRDPGVFLCYSKKDADWLKRIKKVLAPLKTRVTIWSDADIQPGEPWKRKILRALNNASVGVILASPDLLDSAWVTKIEIPKLMKRAESNDVSIVWIPISDCLYEEVGLGEMQAAGDPKRPLDSLSEGEQQSLIVAACRVISKYAQKDTTQDD